MKPGPSALLISLLQQVSWFLAAQYSEVRPFSRRVRLSVCLSHLWSMPKWFKISTHFRPYDSQMFLVSRDQISHPNVCMYVCMSENLYPARLKQKSHSRAAVSNKQKRLQCSFEPFSGQVGWAQRGGETVPDPGSSDSNTPITECTVGASNNEHRSIRR